MLTPETAFPILADCIRNSRRHADYKRVTELRKLYYHLITGDGAETLLRRFVRREDNEAFEQRVAITQLVVIAWSRSIMQQFYRPGRLRNLKRSIGYKVELPDAATKLAEIEDRLSSYWGNESLERWLASRFVALSFQDPNAFLVTEFGSFNPAVEKARPYPVEYSSDEAVLFSYVNNVLEYLIVKQRTSALNAAGQVIYLDKYTTYLENDVIVAQQLPPLEAGSSYRSSSSSIKPTDAMPANGEVWLKNDTERYQVTTYRPNGGQVQAVRVGYQYDEQTNSRTFVNPMHRAVPFFMKSIHETSELDLSIALHAHPQKLFYAQPCPGVPRTPCLSGITSQAGPNGSPMTCQRCLGSGVVVHKSAQDALAVPMPAPGSPAPTIPLKDMVAYVTPDVQLLEFMDKHLRDLRQQAIDAVFNSGVTSSQQSALATKGTTTAGKTATEVVINADLTDNTLAPFADKCAAIWRHKVKLVAEFTDNGGPNLKLVYEYPASFAIKTYDQLLAQRAGATAASAPHYVISELDRQIAEILFSTDDTTLAKIQAKNFFTPFLGKTSEEVFTLISLGKVRLIDEILWTYVDTIFDELGEEVSNFYSLTRARQWELIKPKVDTIIAELPQQSIAIQLPPAP